MRILISGGGGFIGSNLADKLGGHEIIIFDNVMRGQETIRNIEEIKTPHQFVYGNVAEEDDVRAVFRNYKPDFVYHLAAQPSHRLAFKKRLPEYTETDALGTHYVLEECRARRTPLVFASTNKVYGHQPIPHHERLNKEPDGPYGLSKAYAEDLQQMYAKYFDVPSVAIRFHHVVGRRCHSELVLATFVRQAVRNAPLIVNGYETSNGWESCRHDFTSIDDVTTGLKWFLDNPQFFERKFTALNFGTGIQTEVLGLAHYIKEQCNSKSEIVKQLADKHEGLSHQASIALAKELIGWNPRDHVFTAIKQYIDWYLQLPENKRF